MAGSPRRIEIVQVGEIRQAGLLVAWLGPALAERFGARVGLGEPLELRDEWRIVDGEKFNSNLIVDALMARDEPLGEHPPDRWILALTEADLFAPGRHCVFGEAAQGGAWAVISLARLRAGLGSMDPGALLRRRILKEAVHELGHLSGLEHCDRAECVMFASYDVVDTDRKSARYCPACEGVLRDLSGVDRAMRPG